MSGQTSYTPAALIATGPILVGRGLGSLGQCSALAPDAVRSMLDVYTTAEVDAAIAAVDGGVTDHGALTGLDDDDHSQYHTDARGDARYSALGHTHAATDIVSGTIATARLGSGTANSSSFLRGDQTWQTISSGVTDHGALTGLADDDHSQYHTDARGDARYLRLAGGTVTGAVTFNNSAAFNGSFTFAAGLLHGSTEGATRFYFDGYAASYWYSPVGASTALAHLWRGGGGNLMTLDGVGNLNISGGLTLANDVWIKSSPDLFERIKFVSAGPTYLKAYNNWLYIAGTDNVERFYFNAGNGNATFLGNLTLSGMNFLGPYTFATVPSASSNAGAAIRITDRGQKQAYSDGTDWRFVATDAIIA